MKREKAVSGDIHTHNPEGDEMETGSLVLSYSQSTNPGLIPFKCHGMVWCRDILYLCVCQEESVPHESHLRGRKKEIKQIIFFSELLHAP